MIMTTTLVGVTAPLILTTYVYNVLWNTTEHTYVQNGAPNPKKAPNEDAETFNSTNVYANCGKEGQQSSGLIVPSPSPHNDLVLVPLSYSAMRQVDTTLLRCVRSQQITSLLWERSLAVMCCKQSAQQQSEFKPARNASGTHKITNFSTRCLQPSPARQV